MSRSHAPPPLYKHRSWSPDASRDEAWLLRRKCNWKRRSKSVTDDDVEELKGCIELGFGFESSPEVELDHRLSQTLPALGLYHAVNKSYSSDSENMISPLGSPLTPIFGRGDNNPQTVKTRLRQWARVVACAANPFRTTEIYKLQNLILQLKLLELELHNISRDKGKEEEYSNYISIFETLTKE